MIKNLLFILLVLWGTLLSFNGLSQSHGLQPSSSELPQPEGPFLKPSQYDVRWQRLLLQLSFTYFTAAQEGQVSLDSSLLYASHSLGLSRLPVIAEGFDDEDLMKKSGWIDKRDPAKGRGMLPGLRGIKHLQQLVLLGAYYAFQPDSYHTSKDSVLFYLSKAREESKALHELKWGRQALCLLGKMYVEGNALEQGGVIFNQLTKECHADGDIENEAKAWTYRGLYTAYSPGTTKDRIAYLEKARNLYRRQKNADGEINVLTDVGYLWVSALRADKAYGVFLEALRLERSIRFPFTHYNTDDLAMVTLFQGKFGEPLKYALQSVKTAETARDSIGWGLFYHRLGILYFYDMRGNKESMKWLQKSLDRIIRTGRDPTLYYNIFNISILLNFDGRAAEALTQARRIANLYPPQGLVDRMVYEETLGICYLNLKQYDPAEQHFLRAAKLEKQSEPMRGNFRRAAITYWLGTLYFEKGQHTRAKMYFQRVLSDPSHIDLTMPTIAYLQWHLFAIDSASGSYISAIRHYEQYHKIIDSNFRILKLRQAAELNLQYETEKRENEIKIKDRDIRILNQNARLQQANLNKSNFIKNITIGGIVLLLITTSLFYFQYRQKRKANQIITQKNDVITQKNDLLQRLLTEKEWLLKEVHHRVKNNLHTVICLLESQAMYLENDALRAIENSQHRIYAMSLIHQKLYQSEDVKSIDMGVYLPEFIRYLSDSFDVLDSIHFRLDIEPLKLGVSQAIPLGLIINEAVTNSIKHAFPGKPTGEISVQLHQTEEQITLVIADNGIGMHPEIKDIELDSLGIELMKGLSKDINGEIYFETKKGTKITVVFGIDPLNDINSLLTISEREMVTKIASGID
jgi:two-component sensor histidine kinase